MYDPAAVRLGLVPRTSEFYDLFERGRRERARGGAEGRAALPRATRTRPSRRRTSRTIEHEGDRITRDLIQLLNTQYVTPFDREDIYELATALDDVVDLIEEASDLLELYGVESTTRHVARSSAGSSSRRSSGSTRRSAASRSLERVQPELVELKELEDEGDRVVRDAIAALFQDPRIDPLVVIRWKDIYDALENALDACERAANVIGNIVVKNA